MSFETNLISSLSSMDLLVFVALFGLSVAYAIFFVNRGRLVPLLVSTSLALILVQSAPYLRGFPWEYGAWIFGGVFLVIFFLLSRVVLQSPVGVETFGTIFCFLLAFSQVGFGLSILSVFLPDEIIKNFSALLQKIFTGNDTLFYWGAASVLLLLILSRRANRLME